MKNAPPLLMALANTQTRPLPLDTQRFILLAKNVHYERNYRN